MEGVEVLAVFFDFVAKLRLISSSVVSSLLMGIKILSCWREESFSSCEELWAAMLCAPFWAEKEAMVQVTKIIRIVPFKMLSFSRRMGCPSGV